MTPAQRSPAMFVFSTGDGRCIRVRVSMLGIEMWRGFYGTVTPNSRRAISWAELFGILEAQP